MTYYEGLLLSEDDRINLAAIGAEIEDSKLGCQIYRPSDTARNLKKGFRFTYCLTDDPSLFFKGALTGHDDPDYSEIDEDRLKEEEGLSYPKKATRVYFCDVERTTEIKEEDEYGEARIKLVEAKILEKKMQGEYIGRENPLIEAMVPASRMYVAEGEQKSTLERKVKTSLPESDSDLKDRILDFVEEMRY